MKETHCSSICSTISSTTDEHSLWKTYWSKKHFKAEADKLEAKLLKRVNGAAILNGEMLKIAQKQTAAKVKAAAKTRATPAQASRVSLTRKA